MAKVKPRLTEEQEKVMLELYASGMTWAEVSDAMGVAPRIVDFHVQFLRETTGFKSRPGKKRKQTGPDNDNWKGGRRTFSGYVVIRKPEHPRARSNNNYVFEHVLVMEDYIGRYLLWNGRQHPDNEVVHHINGNRKDNRLENLVLMLARDHSYLHVNQKWAKDVYDLENDISYPSLAAASEASGLNEHELATYIHFRWKHNGTLWQYANPKPITGRKVEY